MTSLMVIVVLALAGLSQAQNFSEIIPRENSFFELKCPHEDEFRYWLFHGQGQAYYAGQHFMSEETTVYSNGSVIFKSIKVDFAGTHLCVRGPEKEHVAHPITLRVRPLPPTDLWGQVYESQFLTGLIAAIVIFSIFAFSCLVYEKRWKPTRSESDTDPIVKNGYDNQAMADTDIEEGDSSSTKM